MTHREPQQAFNEAIKRGILSEDKQATNYVGMFMYMHTNGWGINYFKHINSRKYGSTKNSCMRAARFHELTRHDYEVNCPGNREYVLDRISNTFTSIAQMEREIIDFDLPLPEDMTDEDWRDLGDYLDAIQGDRAMERHSDHGIDY